MAEIGEMLLVKEQGRSRGQMGKMIANGKAPIIHDNLSRLSAHSIPSPQQVPASTVGTILVSASNRVFAGWLRHSLHYDCSVVAPLTSRCMIDHVHQSSVQCISHHPNPHLVQGSCHFLFHGYLGCLSHLEAQVNA